MISTFIVCAIAFIFITTQKRSESTKMPPLTIALYQANDIGDYDPKDLRFAGDYNFIRAMYSPLIYHADSGILSQGLADEFYWKDGIIYLKLNEEIYTLNGHHVTMEDVVLTLNRQFLLKSHVHGDLKSIVCPDYQMKNIHDTCPNIEYDTFSMRITPSVSSPFVMQYLASMDFAILPKVAIDIETLEIIDYENTTGPYRYAGKTEEGMIRLQANNGHWLLEDNSPKEIHIYSDRINEKNEATSYEAFVNKSIDHVPTASIWGYLKSQKILKDRNEAEIDIFKTEFIKLLEFSWTPRVAGSLNSMQKIQFSKILREKFHPLFKRYPEVFQEDYQAFPRTGHGRLDADQKRELDRRLEASADADLSDLVIRISARDSTIRDHLHSIDFSPIDVRIVDFEQWHYNNNHEKYISGGPDLVFGALDVAYDEDVKLIAFMLKTHLFPLNKDEQAAWMSEFILDLDPVSRQKKLKNLHFKALVEDPTMIPIGFMRYYAHTQNGWKAEFSDLHARSPYWKIKWQG